MGCVYAVHHDGLNRLCVAKFMLAEAAGPGIERFHREAKLLAKVPHPNIVQVYDSGFDGDDLFIIMEYASGQDLLKWIERPRAWQDVVDVFLQAGRGLAEAHAKGIVHRDFTPRNVRILDPQDPPAAAPSLALAEQLLPTQPDTQRGGSESEALRSEVGAASPVPASVSVVRPARRQVRVIDFGVAGEGDMGLTDDASSVLPVMAATRGKIGTPGYMSPEQLHREAASTLSDQFSFCVCLYEALYRSRPFGDLDEYERNAARGALRVPSCGGARRRLFVRVLHRGLRLDPRQRFPNMQALLIQLERELGRVRRLTTIAAFTGVIAGGIVIGRVLVPGAEDPFASCESSATETADWSAAVRDAAESHIQDPVLRGRLIDRFEEFEAAWQRRSNVLCRSAAAGADPAAVQAERACLDHHHAVVRGVVDRLVVAELPPTAALVDLPDDTQLAACATDDRYAVDRERVHAVKAFESLIAHAESALVFGDYGDSRTHADDALQIAATEPDSRQYALALYQLARVQTYEHDPTTARMSLERAALLAEAHHLTSLAADIYLRTMLVSKDPDARAIYERFLRGKLAELRSDTDPRQADARRMLADDALDMRDFAAVERQLAELERFDRRGSAFARGRTADIRGLLAYHRKQFPAAKRHFEQALALQIEDLGEKHAKHAITLRKLALAHYKDNELDLARRVIARAAEMPLAQQPILAAEVLATRFDIEVQAGREADARAAGKAGLDLYMKLPEDHAGRAGELHLLGHWVRFLYEVDDRAGALAGAWQLTQRFSRDIDRQLPSFALHFGNAARCASDFGDDALVERLLTSLTPAQTCEEPDLCVIGAGVALRRGRMDDALAMAARSAALTRDALDEDGSAIFRESRRIYGAVGEHFKGKRRAKKP